MGHKMTGIPIPQDHNLSTDPYVEMTITVPDSPMWRAIVRGQLLALSDSWVWDSDTGDVEAATGAGFAIFDSIIEP